MISASWARKQVIFWRITGQEPEWGKQQPRPDLSCRARTSGEEQLRPRTRGPPLQPVCGSEGNKPWCPADTSGGDHSGSPQDLLTVRAKVPAGPWPCDCHTFRKTTELPTLSCHPPLTGLPAAPAAPASGFSRPPSWREVLSWQSSLE